jgi:MYXO-CTERM domain-containing protein
VLELLRRSRACRPALALAILFAGARAEANGAFPDSLSIFVPADHPAEIVLATNFGLITTTDDGLTWDWVCEHGHGYLGAMYQRAAPPHRRLFAVAPAGLVFSDDAACSWSVAADLQQTTVTDAFVDRVIPNRVLALAAFIDPGGQARNGLFISPDAGMTFGASAYVSSPDVALVSVEASAANSNRLYMTSYNRVGAFSSHLLRSDDAGATWTDVDITAMTAARMARIAAIDPVDPNRLYLRLTGSDDAIGVSTDGGATVSVSLVVGSGLTALLRRANGQILVSALDVVNGALYRSTDGGASFERMPTTLGIRAMAERAGKLYAAVDHLVDGFALGASDDDGLTFQPLLRFDQVARTRMCGDLAATCAATCDMLVALNVFKPSVCRAATGDGGGGAPPPAGQGCGCGVPAASRASPAPLLATLLLAIALGWRRRTRP